MLSAGGDEDNQGDIYPRDFVSIVIRACHDNTRRLVVVKLIYKVFEFNDQEAGEEFERALPSVARFVLSKLLKSRFIQCKAFLSH